MSGHREPFEAWCIIELMGHRRLAGFVREQEIAGYGFLRLDIPVSAADITAEGLAINTAATATQFYSPASVYGITPVSEETARAVAKGNQPEPVHRWELPAPTQPIATTAALDYRKDLDPFGDENEAADLESGL